MKRKTVIEDASSVLMWAQQQHYAGWDPYDLYQTPQMFRWVHQPNKQRNFLQKVFLFTYRRIEQYYPEIVLRLLNAEKKRHATAMGCFFYAYLNLYEIEGNQSHLESAGECRKWLIENRIPDFEDYCWGTPFEWSSSDIVYTTNVPFAVVCVWIGEAFLKSYQVQAKEEDLDICLSIARFLTAKLYQSENENGDICFSYSPIKKDYVNNSNLFVASYLAKIHEFSPYLGYDQLARSAAMYTIANQLENGMIPYFGKESKDYRISNDSYHSSYEIRCLLDIHKSLDMAEACESALRYYQYFKKAYLRKDGAILVFPEKSKVIDATSLAEYLILIGKHPELDPAQENLKKCLRFIRSNFRDNSSGSYYYKKIDNKTIRIPYIRWVQGWMALGLSMVGSNEGIKL